MAGTAAGELARVGVLGRRSQGGAEIPPPLPPGAEASLWEGTRVRPCPTPRAGRADVPKLNRNEHNLHGNHAHWERRSLHPSFML